MGTFIVNHSLRQIYGSTTKERIDYEINFGIVFLDDCTNFVHDPRGSADREGSKTKE